MKKFIAFVVILFTIGMVNSGFCQIRPGTHSITPYIGGTTFEGNLDLETNPVYGVKLGVDITKQFGAELVLGVIRTHFTEPANEIRTFVYNYRLEGLYYLMPEKRLVPYAAAGIGTQLTDYRKDILDKARFVADYGVGLKYYWSDSMALRADVRHVLASGSIYNNLEYTVGISFLFGGVKPAPVAVVKPEPAPKPAPAKVEAPAPAPEPPKPPAKPRSLYTSASSESQIDVTWNSVKGATQYKVYRDGAYVYTTDTGMAFDQGLKADTRYCYQVSAVDEKGLESSLSSESCATTLKPKVIELKKPAESAASAALAKQIIEKGKANIDIKFDTNKAVVKPQYHKELANFAEVLKNHPDIKLTIQGHTDSLGKADYNMKLSQRRAECVRAYLIQKFGIAPDRLKAKGYGESRPEYDNRVAIGRAKNRRVEAVAEFIKK